LSDEIEMVMLGDNAAVAVNLNKPVGSGVIIEVVE
jgi:hypothetical protein